MVMEVKLHQKEDGPRVLKVLEALKQASHELQTHPSTDSPESNSSSAINALLELETKPDNIISRDPQHSATLKTLVESLRQSSGHLSIRSFLTRRSSTHCLSKLTGSIESEIQAWIDGESLESLTRALEEDPIRDENDFIKLLTQFEDRVAQGFNRELQDLILKSKVFTSLESVLCDSTRSSKRVRERSAFAIAALINHVKNEKSDVDSIGGQGEALVTCLREARRSISRTSPQRTAPRSVRRARSRTSPRTWCCRGSYRITWTWWSFTW